MLLEVVTQPAIEPVTLADAKKHLHILHSSEDAEITAFTLAARRHVEATIGRALIEQTLRLSLPAFPSTRPWIELPRPPFDSVTSVEYRDPDGETQEFTSFHAVGGAIFGRVERFASVPWPETETHPLAVSITYVAGYGDEAADVPQEIRIAILMLTEHLYFNRGATVDGNIARTPAAVDCLVSPHRTFGWI